MNISGNTTENISYENLINKIYEVFNYLLIPIATSSIIGNVLIIIVVAWDKVTTTNILFGILACVDLLSTFLGPVLLIAELNAAAFKYLRSSLFLPIFVEFLGQTIAGLSIWTLVIITIERLLSITIPFNVKQVVTVPRVILAEFATAIAVVVVQYIRHFLAVESRMFQGRWFMYPRSREWAEFFVISDWILFTGIPFIVIITASSVIWIKLRTPFGQGQNQSTRFRSVTTNLLLANVKFLLINIPIRLVNVILYYFGESISLNLYQEVIIRETAIYLLQLNSALNFYVYILSGQKFRENVKQ
ncbi:hypothetical protein DPMN_151035 [Dreissena polymorpha]|uniref:G-protein coupled receptors family 1 profile domain-containing protein n=1 Tax=Dreissena polymorpha TaxID=45954 RepID=A0A9D4FEC3_DREPO|nr:hypothetical protein DPMN_151035 [Dreissena polymorpha]